MAKFAKPATQAHSVIKHIDKGGYILSKGTLRNYGQALIPVAHYCQAIRSDLRSLTPEEAIHYLEIRGEEVGQKTLDMERQAIQAMMHFVTHQLEHDERLDVIKSEHPQILKSRAYTQDQTQYIIHAQRGLNALSTRIAAAAGLRAHELLTLTPLAERAPSERPALPGKFLGMEDTVAYTVHGKGGLIREVRIPQALAAELETHRQPEQTIIPYTDRKIHYTNLYNLSGGQRWSASFSAASKRALGWSHGAHGLRHSYAQQRMMDLQVRHHLSRELSLEIVSQEMGHFRPSITETYLR
ncbi:MAG: hypothetical protein ACRCWR_07600 [Saezia sp.]